MAKGGCTSDGECPSKHACFNGDCVNPCTVIKPCGINAQCLVVDSLPLRTMTCQCLPGYFGNPNVECRSGRIKRSEFILISRPKHTFHSLFDRRLTDFCTVMTLVDCNNLVAAVFLSLQAFFKSPFSLWWLKTYCALDAT